MVLSSKGYVRSTIFAVPMSTELVDDFSGAALAGEAAIGSARAHAAKTDVLNRLRRRGLLQTRLPNLKVSLPGMIAPSCVKQSSSRPRDRPSAAQCPAWSRDSATQRLAELRDVLLIHEEESRKFAANGESVGGFQIDTGIRDRLQYFCVATDLVNILNIDCLLDLGRLSNLGEDVLRLRRVARIDVTLGFGGAHLVGPGGKHVYVGFAEGSEHFRQRARFGLELEG